MKDLLTTIFTGILALIATVAITSVALLPLALVGLLDAVVIVDLWRWFAVPALHVPPISVALAYGLNLLVTSFIRTSRSQKRPAVAVVKEYAAIIARLAAGMLLAWGSGYLVARFWTHTL